MRAIQAVSFLLTASALTLASSVVAAAQEAEQTTAADSGEIIVTAQRTASAASKTPIALSAISGDALRSAGVANATNIGEQVPNVSIVRNNGLQITIRGVTSTDNTEKGDPSAAFLIDGVYIARPQAQEVSFFDIARIEVLRGPQGTLYGRNTTAGLVNVITNRPSDHFEAAGNFEYGNYKTVRADAMVNMPVSDTLALRFSGSYDRRDTYLYQEAGDPFSLNPFKNNLSGRFQAQFKPTSDLTILLRANYSSIKGNEFTSVLGGNWFAPLPAGAPRYQSQQFIGGNFSSKELRTLAYAMAQDPSANNNTWGVDGEVNWDFGPLEMTYLGSYREFNRDEKGTGFLGVAYKQETGGNFKQVSQELRFNTPAGNPLSFQFGGYYFKETSNNYLVLRNLLPAFPYYGFLQGPTKSETLGAFAQGTYKLTDTIRATAGVRYSRDDKSRIGRINQQKTDVFNPLTDVSSPNNARVVSDKVTWRFGLDADLNSRTLLYGVVSSGYKAGGFNGGCSAGTPNCANPQNPAALFYEPETLTAYEIGLKTRTADNALRLNASAFHYDYNNLQVSAVVDIGGAPRQVTTNAAKAKVDGVELEATLSPTQRNRIDLGFTYLDARYDSYFPLGVGNAPNFKGRPLDRAPKYVATAAYAYSLPLNNGGNLEASVRTRLSSSYVLTAQALGRQFTQPSFTRTDLSLRYTAPENRYYVQAYWQNVEDNIVVTAAAVSSGILSITPSDPSTYGVRLGFKF